MSYELAMQLFALSAILPAGATFYFFLFWTWLDFWRKDPARTYAMMFGTFLLLAFVVYLFHPYVFAPRCAFPGWTRTIGWALVAIATVFGFVADRQLGFRVRAFMPFFDANGRIELKTTGAYGVVRHPIYASGILYQIGVFLVTGYLAIAVAWAVFTLGAMWFTRQEERRLKELLDDPEEYERYRQRVPALFPRIALGRRRAR